MSDQHHGTILDSFGGIGTPQSEWSSHLGGLHSRDSSVSAGGPSAFARAIPMLASPSNRTTNESDAHSDASQYSDQDPDELSFSRGHHADIFTNAPDSPAVPQRMSSVSHTRERTSFDPFSNSSLQSLEIDGAASPADPSQSLSRNQSQNHSHSHSQTHSRNHSIGGGSVGPLEREINRDRYLQQQLAAGSKPMSKNPSRISHLSTRSDASPSIAPRASSSSLGSPPKQSSPKKKEGGPAEESELESQLQQNADAEDPNRPRTLKEARALAKERARLRAEARESESVLPSGMSPAAKGIKAAASPAVSSPRHATKPSLTGKTDELRSDPMSSNQRTAEEEQQQSEHRSLASDRSESIYSNDQDAEVVEAELPQTRRELAFEEGADEEEGKRGDRSGVSQRYNTEQQSHALASMDNLQAAVGEALEDLSFGSSTATETTTTGTAIGPSSPSAAAAATADLNPADDAQTPLVTDKALPLVAAASKTTSSPKQHEAEIERRGGEVEEKKMTLDADGDGVNVDNKTNTKSHDVTGFYPGTVPRSATMSGEMQKQQQQQQQADRSANSLPTSTTQPIFPRHISVPSDSSTISSRPTPSRNVTATAARPSRLEVFGKTIPWPAAFDPTPLIEQKRLAPWERAKGYAHYCNDLCNTPSGLQVWLEVVQRPSAVEEQRRTAGRHVRGQGTDASGYAASVRSDATFPIRGDGSKAKEIQTAFEPIPESPPLGMPANIPYPSLVSQQSMAPSTSQQHQFMSSRSSSTLIDDHPATASLSRASATAKGAAGNFFSSLGRRGSTRRTATVGGMTMNPLRGSSSSNYSSGGAGAINSSSSSSSNSGGGAGGAVGGVGLRGTRGKIISGPVTSPPLTFSPSTTHLENARQSGEGNERGQSPTVSRAQPSPQAAAQAVLSKTSLDTPRAEDPATLAQKIYTPPLNSPIEQPQPQPLPSSQEAPQTHQTQPPATISTRGSFAGRNEGSPLPTPTSTTSTRAPMGPRAYSSQAPSAVSAASSASFLTAPNSPRESNSSTDMVQQQHQQLQQSQSQQLKGQYYGISSTGGVYGTSQQPSPNEGGHSSPLYSYMSSSDFTGEKTSSPSPLGTTTTTTTTRNNSTAGTDATHPKSSATSQHTVNVQERGGRSSSRGRNEGLGVSTPSRRGSSTSPSPWYDTLHAPEQAGEYRKGSFSSSTRASNGAGSSNHVHSANEEEALEKLADVLQDADRATLLQYLRRAGGNNLVAIGDYFQDQATGKLRR